MRLASLLARSDAVKLNLSSWFASTANSARFTSVLRMRIRTGCLKLSTWFDVKPNISAFSINHSRYSPALPSLYAIFIAMVRPLPLSITKSSPAIGAPVSTRLVRPKLSGSSDLDVFCTHAIDDSRARSRGCKSCGYLGFLLPDAVCEAIKNLASTRAKLLAIFVPFGVLALLLLPSITRLLAALLPSPAGSFSLSIVGGGVVALLLNISVPSLGFILSQ